MKPLSVTLTLLLYCLLSQAQQSSLDQYIQRALSSNIALQQRNLSYQKSLEALKEAKGMFFPSFSVEARYSVARGGRAFEIPVGDLMNPVYDNLNLINSLGAAANPDYPTIPEYPQIQNEQINFLRETEQETFVRMVMPVFNAAIIANHRIQQNLNQAELISVDRYKRELVKEVKTGYYQYLQALQGRALFEETLLLVEENLETTRSLERNHKVTVDAVYSAEAQVEMVKQQLTAAVKDEKVAKAYFNFLLNKDLETEIEIPSDIEIIPNALNLEAARQQALNKREELLEIEYFHAATDQELKLNKQNRLPKLNLVADYGVQGTGYNIDSEADFALGSIVMSWNFLDFTNKAKVQQAALAKLEIEQQRAEATQQIELQVIQSYYEMEAALKNIEAAKAESKSSDQAFKLIRKKYQQGQVNLVTFTEARTTKTNAAQQLIIAQYNFLSKQAHFEWVTASYSFN